MSSWTIGIDIGGTFTDLVALDIEGGDLCSLKVLTTHDDPTLAVAEGARRLIETHRIDPSRVHGVVHASTLFTNALIERRGCRTGLIVTRGFKDVLEIGNERKYDLYDLRIDRVEPLVPRNLRREVSARHDAQGNELAPLIAAEVRDAVDELVSAGVESIAVCLLHAYRRDDHERKIGEWIGAAHPSISITLSSAVAPVIREFERLSTTVGNAYIKPLAQRYLGRMRERLEALGLSSEILMMLSNGGLAHLDEARRNPIVLLESGPAAGAISAAHFGARDGLDNLLAFDMGGTTAKLCLVEHGRPSITYGFEAARRKRFAEGSGIPLSITTVDLIEIGAGGGSLASRDALELLKVGPQSAGSMPGPACYGLGGMDATVTDANLLLGYLDPANFAGGGLDIDARLASDALSRLGAQFQSDALVMAWGIHDIVAENMAAAARVHVAERGRDPRDFVLVSTGGGGPVHAYHVAQKIGVRTIVCPPAAGVASAFGLLVAPARTDRSRTVSFRPASDPLSALEGAFVALEQAVRTTLAPLDATFGPVALTRRADGRFVGQGFNLTVDLPSGPYLDGDSPDPREALLAAFEAGYRSKFGRTPPEVPIELVNLRVLGEAPPRRPLVARVPAATGAAVPVPTRLVYFQEAAGHVEAPVYQRAGLPVGFTARGPLLVEEPSTTLVVGPRAAVRLSDSGNLVVDFIV